MTKTTSTFYFLLMVYFAIGQQDSLTFTVDVDSVYITASAGVGRTHHRIGNLALNQNPVQNISSAINEVPGVYMHTGTLNTNRITVRGIGNRSLFSTTKLRSYIDDIPLTNGVGETTVEDFDREILQSVDLYKGPGATAYGSGLGGLMLLRTMNSPDDNFVKTQMAVGQFGFIKTNHVVSFTDDKFRLKLLQSYNHSDGYRQNNSYDNRNYSVLGGYNNGAHQFSILLHHININAQIPSSLSREDFDAEPKKAAFAWAGVRGYEDYTKTIIGATYSTVAVDKFYWKSTIFANLYNGYESRPFNILDDDSSSYGLRSTLSYDLDNNYNSHFLFGLEWSKEAYNWNLFRTENGVQGAQFQENLEDRMSTQLFVQYSMDILENLKVEMGLNSNRTNYTLEDQFNADSINISGDYNYDWIVSPRLNLKYSISQNRYVYFLLSHGYSIPTLEETLTPNGLINIEIMPEIGFNVEIGFREEASIKKLNYGFSIYHMKVQDLLVARRTAADQFIGINAGGSRHVGLEIDGRYRMILSGDWRSELDLAYTYQNFFFTDFVDDGNDYSGNQLTGSLPHQFALGWKGGYKGFNLSLKYKYFDRMPMRDDNTIYSDAYTLLDIYASQSVTFGDFNIVTHIGVNNLLDVDYASMILVNASSFGGSDPRYYYPGLPVNIFIQTALKYNF